MGLGLIRSSPVFPRSVQSVTVHVMRSVSWGSDWTPSPRSWPVFGGSVRNWPQRTRRYGRRHCVSVATTPLLFQPPLLLLPPPPMCLMLLLPPPLHPSFPPPRPPPPLPLRSTLNVSWSGWGKDRLGLQSQNQWGMWTWTQKRWVNKRWVCSVLLD